jgi:uncharacterized membrane protein
MSNYRYNPPTKNLYPRRPTYRTSSSDPASEAMKTLNIIFVLVVVIGLLYFAHSMGAF